HRSQLDNSPAVVNATLPGRSDRAAEAHDERNHSVDLAAALPFHWTLVAVVVFFDDQVCRHPTENWIAEVGDFAIGNQYLEQPLCRLGVHGHGLRELYELVDRNSGLLQVVRELRAVPGIEGYLANVIALDVAHDLLVYRVVVDHVPVGRADKSLSCPDVIGSAPLAHFFFEAIFWKPEIGQENVFLVIAFRKKKLSAAGDILGRSQVDGDDAIPPLELFLHLAP